MPVLEPIILIGGCLLCFGLGFLAAAIGYRRRLKRAGAESWRAAILFYTRQQTERETRL
jgi:hypothetical protein